jgi:hypothetical protein
MISIRHRPAFLALAALLAGSLACASLGGNPTDVPLVPTIERETDRPEPTDEEPIGDATEEQATAEPTESDSEDPTEAPSGDVLFEDAFDEDSERWTIGEETASTVTIHDGVMDIEILESQYMGWSHLFDDEFSDVRVEFDVEPEPEDQPASWGVICNYADSANFYYMSFGSDGYYAIARYLDDDYLVLSDEDGNYVESELIEKDKSSYHVEATCANGSFELMVDGKRIASVEDDALTGGTVGLMVETFDGSHAQARFDNVLIYPAE